MKKRTACIAAAAVLVCGPAYAQKTVLQPGEYRDGSGGALSIKPGKDGAFAFKLNTFGTNRHSCDAQGTIAKSGIAVLKEDKVTCTLQFAMKGDTVDVTLKDVCNAFCGAGATLDGTFYKVAAGCEPKAVQASRNEFRKLYEKKAYAEARTLLEPLVKRCQKTIEERDDGWLRNDLALAYLRLGDTNACRTTLEPFAAYAAKSDDKNREDLGPNQADILAPVIRATRTNLKLCSAAAAKAR
jgi:hypothetical protein